MTEPDKTERERFEAWHVDYASRRPMLDAPDGMWADDKKAWAAWQARAALGTGFERDALKAIEDECWDLRCVDIHTGGDDDDVEWQVISHWQAKPYERLEGSGSTPAAALREAMKLAAAPQPPASAGDGDVEPVAWAEFAENGNVRFWTADHARKVRKELRCRALTPLYTAPPAQPVAVSVKPLEWSGNENGYQWRGLAGEIERYVILGWDEEKPYEFGEMKFATLDAAKSAAQADYEQRIRSALMIEPTQPDAFRQGAETACKMLSDHCEYMERVMPGMKIAPVLRALPLPGDKEG